MPLDLRLDQETIFLEAGQYLQGTLSPDALDLDCFEASSDSKSFMCTIASCSVQYKLILIVTFVTDHVRSTRKSNVFTRLCDSIQRERGSVHRVTLPPPPSHSTGGSWMDHAGRATHNSPQRRTMKGLVEGPDRKDNSPPSHSSSLAWSANLGREPCSVLPRSVNGRLSCYCLHPKDDGRLYFQSVHTYEGYPIGGGWYTHPADGGGGGNSIPSQDGGNPILQREGGTPIPGQDGGYPPCPGPRWVWGYPSIQVPGEDRGVIASKVRTRGHPPSRSGPRSRWGVPPTRTA